MIKRPALLCLAALMLAGSAQSAPAQSLKSMAVNRPPAPSSRGGGVYRGGRGGVATGIISTRPPPRVYGDNGPVDGGYGPPPSWRQAQRRLMPDEVVVELRNSATLAQIAALQRRFRLARIARTPLALTGTTFFRWRIPDRRAVATVVRQLEADGLVASAQPNYRFALQETAAVKHVHLPEAHTLAKGDAIRIAMIDPAIDVSHPDLEGAVAGTPAVAATPSLPVERVSTDRH